MNSLVRIAVIGLIAFTSLAACGDTERTNYIAGFDPPTFSSFRGGTTAPLKVILNEKAKEKSYVDLEISGTDQQWLTTNPTPYLIVAAQSAEAMVDITGKFVTAPTPVSILFKLRGTTESRTFGFTIIP